MPCPDCGQDHEHDDDFDGLTIIPIPLPDEASGMSAGQMLDAMLDDLVPHMNDECGGVGSCGFCRGAERRDRAAKARWN